MGEKRIVAVDSTTWLFPPLVQAAYQADVQNKITTAVQNFDGVAQAVADKLGPATVYSPYISPAAYGVVGDGTTDDTSALNAWAAACAGKLGLLPPKTYKTTGSITIPTGANISAYGATLSAQQPGNQFNVLTVASGVTIAGVKIVTDWTHIGTTAIKSTNTSNVQIRDVTIFQVAGKGIWFDHVTDFQINRCVIGSTLEQAINLDYCRRGKLTENSIDSAQHGIQWWGGDSGNTSDYAAGPQTSHLTIADNIIRNGNTNGTSQVSAGIWGSLGRFITITGNVVENWNDFCIDLEGTTDSTVVGNTCHEGGNGILGVNNGSSRNLFDSNVAINDVYGGPAFRADWGGTVTWASIDLKITNNYFKTQLAAFTAAYRDANGSAVQRSVFSDNVIEVHAGTDLYAGLVFVQCPEMTVERNRITLDNGQSGIRMIGCSNANVNGNKVLTLNAGPAAASTGGGISLEFYSNAWPARNNIVRGNTIRGFSWGIYDKVGGDAGYNLFDGNLVNQIVHNDGGGYRGYNGNNRNDSNPTNASGFVASNG